MVNAVPFRDRAFGGVDPGMGSAEADHVTVAQDVIDVTACLLGEPRVMRLGRDPDGSTSEEGKPTVGRYRRPRAGDARRFHERASVNDSMDPSNETKAALTTVDTGRRQIYKSATKGRMKPCFIYESCHRPCDRRREKRSGRASAWFFLSCRPGPP